MSLYFGKDPAVRTDIRTSIQETAVAQALQAELDKALALQRQAEAEAEAAGAYEEPTSPLLYIGLGLGALVLIGGAIALSRRGKKMGGYRRRRRR